MHSDEESFIEENSIYDPSYTTPDTTTTSNEPSPTLQPPRMRWLILEIPVFLLFFAKMLNEAVYQNQLLFQTCVSILKLNDSVCVPLLGVNRESEDARKIEEKVQPYVTEILMARSLLESIIPAFVSLFIGPWSDKYGRRPIVLSTFTGYLTGYIILTVLAFISTKTNISPWWFLLGSVPSVLSGGSCALITGIYCYISDVAKQNNRALRMVLNEAALLGGMTIGNLSSGYIYGATNVFTVFGISSISLMIALSYAIFFATESLTPDQIHGGSKIREFFRFDLVKDLVRTCFNRRPNLDRAIIWLTMIALTIAIFVMEGDNNVTYLFVREKFEWTLKDWTQFYASRIVTQIIGSLLGMFLLKRIFKFSIITMTMLSFASSVLESTVRATAVYWWEMYLGVLFGCMRGIMGPMARALLSHVAPPTEVGKIFALTTSLESLSPLGAAPLYTTVYRNTLTFNPSLFNFISTGLNFVCFILSAVIYGIQKSFSYTSAYQAIGS